MYVRSVGSSRFGLCICNNARMHGWMDASMYVQRLVEHACDQEHIRKKLQISEEKAKTAGRDLGCVFDQCGHVLH